MKQNPLLPIQTPKRKRLNFHWQFEKFNLVRLSALTIQSQFFIKFPGVVVFHDLFTPLQALFIPKKRFCSHIIVFIDEKNRYGARIARIQIRKYSRLWFG